MEKIVYCYEHKDELHQEWFFKLIDKLYSLSYPKPNIDFKTMDKVYPLLANKTGKYKYPFDFYYLPHKVCKIVVDDFLEKYGFAFHWKDDMEFLLKILFEGGGIREVYSADEHNDKPYRHCIDVEVLEKHIPKEYADKVKEILEGYKNTYKFGSRDYNSMLFSVMNSPNSNRETVINAWKEVFGEDIQIPDDSSWVDEYDAEDTDAFDDVEEFDDTKEDGNKLS